ncbi:hypothetical protein EGW08_010424, partial [Elysia chlorotica]
DSSKRASESSPPHEILATFDPFASVEKAETSDVFSASSVQGRDDKFSFYSVFSTTVSSLEDIDGGAEVRRTDKTDLSPDQHSAVWDGGDTTPSADSVFSAFSAGYERSVSESSQGRKESFGGFPPGEAIPQKKPKPSEDSGESSKESVSRDSMRVNLSQESSVADPQDDSSVLSHLQMINGYLDTDEVTPGFQPAVNTAPRIEVGLTQRHLDLASMLLPMAESASTDSMFVHVSTDSLHSAVSGRGVGGQESDQMSEQKKLSDKSSRAQLSNDLRRKNLMEQSRRRSLPSSQMKIVEKSKREQQSLYTSQSMDSSDSPDLAVQRPSSVPVARPRPSAARTLQRIGSTSAPRLQYIVPETGTVVGPSVVEPPVKTSASDKPTGATNVAATSPPTQAVSPNTARPRPSAKRGSISSEKGVPVSINLGQVVNILAGTTAASTQQTATKVKVQKPQRTKIHFTIAAKAPVPTVNVQQTTDVSKSKQETFVSNLSSNNQPTQPPLTQKSNSDGAAGKSSQKHGQSPGFLHERKQEMCSVDSVQPPDLVPYEETFTSSMRGLPESTQPSTADQTRSKNIVAKSTFTDSCVAGRIGASSEREENVQKTQTNLTDRIVDKEVNEANTESAVLQKDKLGAPENKNDKGSSRNSIVKSNSGSDSDGGDIDTIVQEFKEDNSEDGDIDDLVKEFIEEHPEAAATAAPHPEPEMTRQHSVGLNKFGRVLNKMQSVTKYMTKKKTLDEEPKSPPVKMKMGRRSRTVSQNEGDDVSSEVTAGSAQQQTGDQTETAEGGGDKKEEPDPFELLSKAAEVFKSQTGSKTKSPRHRAARVWRSMTVDHDVEDLEGKEDCDLVTRAAVLFKGFKGKKALMTSTSDSKALPSNSATSTDNIVPGASKEGTEMERKEGGINRRPADAKTFPLVQEVSEDQNEEHDQVSSSGNDGAVLPNLSATSDLDDRDRSNRNDRPSDTGIDTDTAAEMEESTSRMDDSGFESSIRYAAESSVRSDDDDDDTDGPGKVNSLLDSAREHAVFSVVELTTPEINTYENMTSKLGASIHDYVEKCMLSSIEKVVVHDRQDQDLITGDGIIVNEVEWPEKESKKGSVLEYVVRGDGYGQAGEHGTKEVKMRSGSVADDQSTATDSGLDAELKLDQAELHAPRPLSQTCDLILSTGYDDTKNANVKRSDSSEKPDGAAQLDAREKTNGKLEELTKEILAVETASFEVVPSNTEGNKLNIKSPEYQRLSSDSSENPDSNSMTVNLPDSPENGMSLSGDGPFSLCCGANFKINLNCTAMMKKPERRPSKVVIENKRCAMTEEEKLFPLKVSSSFRENPDKQNPPEPDTAQKPTEGAGAVASSSSKSGGNTLKVSEHERNRDFAGSREELLDQRKSSQSKDPAKEQEPSKADVNDSEIARHKKRSLVEESNKDKGALENYDTVLDELSKKRREGEALPAQLSSFGAKKDDAQNQKERARSKRYGRVISESEFDDGLLPSASTDVTTNPVDADASKVLSTNEICEEKFLKEEDHKQGKFEIDNYQEIVSNQPGSSVVSTGPSGQPRKVSQPGIDVYDNVKPSDLDSRLGADAPPPLPARDPIRHRPRSSSGNSQNAHRYHQTPVGSMSSVVSDEGSRQGIRADVYLKARRAYIVQAQGKTKWVSSTPHLPTIERGGDTTHGNIPPQGTRHSSFPHLHANSDLDLHVTAPPGHQYNYTYKTHHRGHSEGSASSFGSESICWGNYARVADLQLQERAPSCDDSESSTSGLFIPGGGGGVPAGCGRASTLSDVSDGYIFGDYSTVKDDIRGEEHRGVIRPLDNQNHHDDYSFRFRHFPASGSHAHYENIEDLVVTTQPMGGPRQWASGPDIYCDNNYAVIGYPQQVRADYQPRQQAQTRASRPAVPMSSIGVQMSGPPSLAPRQGGALRVSNCASQTSLDSLVGLVGHDASDILEGLPVYEYTLGAGVESEDELSEGQSLGVHPASTQCPDLGQEQPDVTRQTASLDRRQLKYGKKKGYEVTILNNDPATGRRQGAGLQEGGVVRAGNDSVDNSQARRKETRVTFSRDAVLTEVIDELRRSEADQATNQQQQQQQHGHENSGGRGFRVIAASTLTSIGGGVKEFARMINSPFHCCRSARAEPKVKPKVGGPVVL